MIYEYRLKELRTELELTQDNLAKIINVQKDVYGQYERGSAIIPIKHLNTLCNYFNVSIDYIFNLTQEKHYSDSLQEIDKKKVGERIKSFRKENKLTQIKLAGILNIGNGTIADYERGRYIIATPFLYDICKKYHISADYLLGKVNNPKYLK